MNKLKLIMRRRWPLLVVGALIGLVASLAIQVNSDEEPAPKWVARQVVLLDLTQSTGSGSTVISQGAALMTQGRVPEVAAEALGFEGSAADLGDMMTTAVDATSLSIEVSTTDPDAEVAVQRVSAFSDAFIEVVSERSVELRAKALEDATAGRDAAAEALAQFDAVNPGVADLVPVDAEGVRLTDTRAALVETLADSQQAVEIAQNAVDQGPLYYTQGPEKPVKTGVSSFRIPTSRWFNTALLGLLGAGLAAALIALIERLNPRIDTKHDIAANFDFPVLGEVIKLRRMYRQGKQRTAVSLDLPSAESYRRIRSVFRFSINRHAEARLALDPNRPAVGSTVFMVVSALPDEGKSTTVAMTALALAESGVPTLAVGCDYRRPTIDTLLGVRGTAGITSRAEMSIDRPALADIVFPTQFDDLWIAPSGPSTTNVAGCADVAREVISAARSEGLSVIVDTTPMLLANDAAEILDVVDEVVIVVRSGQTPVKALHQVVDQLEQQGRTLLGAILIGSPDLSRMLNYYSDYYDAPPEDMPPRRTRAKSDPPPTSSPNGNGSAVANGAVPAPTEVRR